MASIVLPPPTHPRSQFQNFLTLSPTLLSSLKCVGGRLPLRAPLLHPHPPKGILVGAAETGSSGGPPKSLELLHQSSRLSSVPHVLGKPNQRQTLNSSCSRPIKALLQCRLPLLKSDILVINKSERQGESSRFFLLISFSPLKKVLCYNRMPAPET